MNEEEKKLAFAEAFSNLLLLVFEDLPVRVTVVSFLFCRNRPKLTYALLIDGNHEHDLYHAFQVRVSSDSQTV